MQGQSGFKAALEHADLDLDRDLLSKIAGEPQETDHWGARVSGSHALQFNDALGFDALEVRCMDLLKVHDKKDYKTKFSSKRTECHACRPPLSFAGLDRSPRVLKPDRVRVYNGGMSQRREGLRERTVGLLLAGLGLIVVLGAALLALFTLALSGWIPEGRSFTDVAPGYAIAIALGLLTLFAGVWVYRRNRR